MIEIKEYILHSKVERQAHLKLNEPCVERGGDPNSTSIHCKALLAYILDTTIPAERKIYVCHACNNNKCSNPYHLYWGTPKENKDDAFLNGKTLNPYEYVLRKYGPEQTRKFTLEGAAKGLASIILQDKQGGKGKKKTEEHKQNISESIRLNWIKRKAKTICT